MADELRAGDRVRVRQDCNLTLPHYARVRMGEVVGETAGMIDVRFDDDHVYPVPPEWLERVEHDDSVDDSVDDTIEDDSPVDVD